MLSYTRPASKIITPNRGTGVFRNELRKCVRTFHGRFVYCGNGEGIEALAKPIFVRAQPFNGSGTAVPFNGWHAPCLGGVPCALFIQNHCAKSGSLGFSERTPEVCTNLSWEVRLLRERGGDRSIGKANLRKGAALQWKRHCRPLQWLARPVPGWHVSCPHFAFDCEGGGKELIIA